MRTHVKIVPLLALCALGGCAMSPTHVQELSTQELCVDQAEALLQGGYATEGGWQTRVNGSDIDAALSARGASCNDADYQAIAEQRIELQQERNAAMTSALLGAAAAYNQATYTAGPVYEPTPAPAAAAPVYNGRNFTPSWGNPTPQVTPPAAQPITVPVPAQPAQAPVIAPTPLPESLPVYSYGAPTIKPDMSPAVELKPPPAKTPIRCLVDPKTGEAVCGD